MKYMFTLKACKTILGLNYKVRVMSVMVHLNNACVVTQ